MTSRIGDRPRFPLPNQRFDKGDAENIARYYEEIIARFTGSIYGQAWGFVSAPMFEVVSVTDPFTGTLNYIRPKRCALLYSVPASPVSGGTAPLNTTGRDEGPWAATIVQFDPARPGQPVQSLLTLPAFDALQRPWILFRRQETNTATGNKAYWDTASNTEEVGAAPLQRTEYVEFRLSAAYSPNDRTDGWYRCAYIDSWGTPASAATPVIVPVHWMDSQYYADTLPPTQGTRVASALAHPEVTSPSTTGFSPQTEMPELAKLLHWIVGKLGQHYSATVQQVYAQNAGVYNLKEGAFVNSSATEGWLGRPVRGLLEIESYLNTLETIRLPELDADIIANENLWDKYTQTPRLLHTLYVKPTNAPTGFTEWLNYTFTVTSLTTTPSAPVSASNSFSPTLVPYSGSAVGASELGYRIATAVQGGNSVLNVDLIAGSNFVVTSLEISFQADEAAFGGGWPTPAPELTLKYSTTAPASMPPSSYVRGTTLVRTTEEFGALDRRAIVINVYGRNV
jgi:hypothetical protein